MGGRLIASVLSIRQTMSVQELWCHNAEGTEVSVEFDLDGALKGGFPATRTRQGHEEGRRRDLGADHTVDV